MKLDLISNIFAPHVIGGYELGCQMIADQLVALGHDVQIITSEVVGQLETSSVPAGLSVQRIFEPVFEYDDGHRCRDLTAVWERRQAAFGGVLPGNAIALAHWLSARQPDVIWIFNPLGLGPVGILEAALTCPARCLIHLMDHVDGVVADHQDDWYLLPRWQRLKQSIDAISCSRKILYANETAGAYRTHRVIYNGVSFRSIPSVPPFRLPHPDGSLRLVYTGQVVPEKGALELVRGVHAATQRDRKSAVHLDLIGRITPRFEIDLLEEIRAAGLQSQVRLLGQLPRPELLSRLAEYDAAVMLLSDLEPFGYAPLEAAAAGLPVILTSGPGVRECFPADYPLTVSDRSNPQEIARLINWCLEHRSALPTLGRDLCASLQSKCDLEERVIPAYLRRLDALSPNPGKHSLSGLLASHYSRRCFHLVGQGTHASL